MYFIFGTEKFQFVKELITDTWQSDSADIEKEF